MNSLNRVMLMGNLTRDPAIRKTGGGTAVADLGLALSESYTSKDGKKEEKTCFVDVVAWDRQADACAEYLKKGSRVFVEGRLQLDEWKDKEGGQRSKIRVRADRVLFMTPAHPGRGDRNGRGDGDEPFERGGRGADSEERRSSSRRNG